MNFTINRMECRPNCIIAAFIDVKSKNKKVLEISNRKNDYSEMVKELSKKECLIIGYNNSNYENILYNFLIENYYVFIESDYKTICNDTYLMWRKLNSGSDVSEIRQMKFFESIDLKTILFSKENRLTIQEMQASIQYPDIYQLEYERDNLEDISIVRKKVATDCVSIFNIFKHSKEYLQLRLWVFKELKIDCLALDNVTSGSLILGKKYCEATNQDYSLFREKTRYFSPVSLKDIVFKSIKYNTDEFNVALNTLKAFTIKKKSDYPYIPIIYRGKKFALTGGGLHSHESPRSYKDGLYIQADCISQYPSFIHNNSLLDPEFDPVFLDIYHEAFMKKKEFDEDPIKRNFFKLIINSYYGCLLNEYKPFFCPEIAFTTTVNCQLLMLMLIEKLMLSSIEVTSVNTDSIDVLLNPGQESLYYEIMQWWCSISGFEMTYKHANRVFRKDCNSYIMELINGDVITKGDYNIENTFGKIHSNYVSKLASVNYILHNIPVSETVNNHGNIYDYCDYLSKPENGSLYLNDLKINGDARFYACRKGGYLYKKFNSGRIESINGKMLFKTLNKKIDIPERKDINLAFYITKANLLNSNLINSKIL